jgi:hypothetical protein
MWKTVHSFDYPDWTIITDSGTSQPPDPPSGFPLIDVKNLEVIKTSLVLEDHGKLPFKPQGRTSWTSKERGAAEQASVPKNLNEFSSKVRSLHFIYKPAHNCID